MGLAAYYQETGTAWTRMATCLSSNSARGTLAAVEQKARQCCIRLEGDHPPTSGLTASNLPPADKSQLPGAYFFTERVVPAAIENHDASDSP